MNETTRSEEAARRLLKLLYGWKTAPPTHREVEMVARVLREYAAAQAPDDEFPPATTDPIPILRAIVGRNPDDPDARSFVRRCLRLARAAGRKEAAKIHSGRTER
jgi:alkanesulfonate monooxygenase SsuD/methylene tetrahydromethanopterin reductase-like flavin-dependent oxidoreductase (luciferase family)